MSSGTLFTRRMSSGELDIWLSLLDDVTTAERKFAESFMKLEDSMFFLASIGQETVGGTAIFRDRTRLAMALVSVQHSSDFNEIAKQQLLKSSLPFFRSVAIHHVDVIASASKSEEQLPFPLNFEVGTGLRSALEGLGFAEEQPIYHYSIEIAENRSKNARRMNWKESHDHDAVRDLYWRQNKTTGIDCSLVILGWEMAMTRGVLVTLGTDTSASIAFGAEEVGESVVVWPLIADLLAIDPSAAAEVVHDRIAPIGAARLVIPLVASGQQEMMAALGDLCAGEVAIKETTLMRKQL